MDDSIIHPATVSKLPGRKWPLNSVDQMHLEKVLPVLTRTHHAIAYMKSNTHNVHDALGLRINAEIQNLVSNFHYHGLNIKFLKMNNLEPSENQTVEMLNWRKNSISTRMRCKKFQKLGSNLSSG